MPSTLEEEEEDSGYSVHITMLMLMIILLDIPKTRALFEFLGRVLVTFPVLFFCLLLSSSSIPLSLSLGIPFTPESPSFPLRLSLPLKSKRTKGRPRVYLCLCARKRIEGFVIQLYLPCFVRVSAGSASTSHIWPRC